MKTLTPILGALLFVVPIADAALVTLTAESSNGTNGISELSVGPYEVAELVSFPATMNSGSEVLIQKDGRTFGYTMHSTDAFFAPIIVAGPATLRLITALPTVSEPGPNRALCTVRITPEAYPPDRALLLPPGTNQTLVSLECSTNLVQWFAATNGVYGPLPEALFFRIKLDPVR